MFEIYFKMFTKFYTFANFMLFIAFGVGNVIVIDKTGSEV